MGGADHDDVDGLRFQAGGGERRLQRASTPDITSAVVGSLTPATTLVRP